MTEAKRPLITANMVTFARLLPMPLLAVWLYSAATDHRQLWAALIVGTIIGCTDFVDGYLARKQGPTVLGGLVDPIADKVFVALVYTPFADIGVIPAWALALMFVREFVVTALRSSYEKRDLHMKTSYLAKVKTWTQMQGIGVLMLFPLIHDQNIMAWVLGVGVVLPLIAMTILWVVKKKLWKGALVMSAALGALLAVHLKQDPNLTTAWFIMIIVVALTWISGIDYFVGAFKQLRGRGDLGSFDLARLLGALAVPCTMFAALVESPAPAWPLFTVLALELAVGGLDNLLAHHGAAARGGPWGLRTLGASALMGACVLVPSASTPLAIAAGALSTAGVVWEFWRGRDYYVDARIRAKARAAAAA